MDYLKSMRNSSTFLPLIEQVMSGRTLLAAQGESGTAG
jgi:hypothetical protein